MAIAIKTCKLPECTHCGTTFQVAPLSKILCHSVLALHITTLLLGRSYVKCSTLIDSPHHGHRQNASEMIDNLKQVIMPMAKVSQLSTQNMP